MAAKSGTRRSTWKTIAAAIGTTSTLDFKEWREECKFATSRSHQQRPPTRWRKLTQCAPNGGQHDCLRSQPYRPASSQRRFMVRWDMANVEIWNLNLESMALTADRKPLTQ